MEHTHKSSKSRLSFEDSRSLSRCRSDSTKDDVLSLNSWSEFENLESELSSRDQNINQGPLAYSRCIGSSELASPCGHSKDLKTRRPINHEYNYTVYRNHKDKGQNVRKSVASCSSNEVDSQSPFNTMAMSNKSPNAINSNNRPLRSRSISNIETRHHGRPTCASTSLVNDYSYPFTIGSEVNFECDTNDQPPNPFQDFSFPFFPSNESINSFSKPKQKLYPVLDRDRIEHGSNHNGSSFSAPQRCLRGLVHDQNFLGEIDEGPASMPVASQSTFQEGASTFNSLPVSVSLVDQPLSPSRSSKIISPLNSQNKLKNKDSEAKGIWSILKLHQSQPVLSKAPMLKRQPKSSSDLEALRESFEHKLEHDNMKTKVMSAWNNLKYGWMFNTKSTMKYDSPLFMLGRCYHMRKEDNDPQDANEFLKDFTSRIWMTYRSNFYPIPGTKLMTDCGWGCMLRSAQMLICQCLVSHYLGRDWRLHNPQTETEQTYYREIIRWFSDPVDAPSDKMPFSLHNLVSFGRHYNKEPGEWFGPSSAAYIFRDAFARASQTFPILSQLCIYVAQDCTVYMDDVIKLCTSRDKSESLSNSSEADNLQRDDEDEVTWLRSLIILIPMRLGGEVINEIYIPCVQNLLTQGNCMGIIGGKPKHSLYFIGWQDNKLIHLDPHFCREAVDTNDKNFRIESYHCMTPKKLTITKMDPSCTVGFYIRNAAEFQKFVSEVKEYVFPKQQRGAYPLFIFADGSHDESSHHTVHTGQDRGRVKVTHYQIDKNGQKQRTYSRDSEDFIIL